MTTRTHRIFLSPNGTLKEPPTETKRINGNEWSQQQGYDPYYQGGYDTYYSCGRFHQQGSPQTYYNTHHKIIIIVDKVIMNNHIVILE
eukprot:383810_1